jgi:hypothetical protein
MRTKIVATYTQATRNVIDSHPENACMDNPCGLIWGNVHMVTAEAEDGRRWNHVRDLRSEEAAEALARRIGGVGTINLIHWVATYPVYGSPAWRGEECERGQALAFAVRVNDQEAIDRLA